MITLFALVLARILGLFLGAPILSNTSLPMRIRVAISSLLAVAMMATVHADTLPADGYAFAVAMTSEALVGLAIGLLVRLVFVAFEVAGELQGFQMGLAMANVFDPESQSETAVLGSLYLNLVSISFLLMDGHHLLIRALAASFDAFPVGGALDAAVLTQALHGSASSMWATGARIAAPVTGVLLLMNALLGFLNRVMPQMSIFNVGFPLTAMAGYLAVLLTVPETVAFFLRSYGGLEDQLGLLLGR